MWPKVPGTKEGWQGKQFVLSFLFIAEGKGEFTLIKRLVILLLLLLLLLLMMMMIIVFRFHSVIMEEEDEEGENEEEKEGVGLQPILHLSGDQQGKVKQRKNKHNQLFALNQLFVYVCVFIINRLCTKACLGHLKL